MILEDSGIIKDRGILSSEGIIVPHGIIVSTDSPVDPLAGLDFLFRGYGLPDGAFQDSALTTPSDTDGDPLGGWEDENGVAFIQATEAQRPTLEDVWAARFGGTQSLRRADFDLSGDFSVFIRQATTGDCCLLGNNDSASLGINNQIIRIVDAGLYFDSGAGSLMSDALSSPRGVMNNVGIIRSGSTVTFYEGTESRGSASIATAVKAGTIGGVVVTNVLLLPTVGDIAAVLIADTDMTANLTQINDALNAL